MTESSSAASAKSQEERTEQVFPYPILNLRSDRVELRPIVPEAHYKKLAQVYRDNSDMSRYFSYPDTSDEWTLESLRRGARNPKQLMHAIYTAPIGAPSDHAVPVETYEYAGTASFQWMEKDNLWAEIGISVWPEYQKSHVATHAIGLMLHRLLDLLPDAQAPPRDRPFPGLGIRRVVWKANSANAPSVNLGKRMGFTLEGIIRNTWVLDEGKVGDGRGRPGDAHWPKVSEDTWQGSITGLDWDGGVRDLVDKQMARTK